MVACSVSAIVFAVDFRQIGYRWKNATDKLSRESKCSETGNYVL